MHFSKASGFGLKSSSLWTAAPVVGGLVVGVLTVALLNVGCSNSTSESKATKQSSVTGSDAKADSKPDANPNNQLNHTTADTTVKPPTDELAVADQFAVVTAPLPLRSNRLKSIDYQYNGGLFAPNRIHITVSPTGLLHCVRFVPDSPRTPLVGKQTAQGGQLTPEQIKDLIKLFAGFDALENRYTRLPDSGSILIQYGDKKVDSGGDPKIITDIQTRLEGLAAPMDHLAEF